MRRFNRVRARLVRPNESTERIEDAVRRRTAELDRTVRRLSTLLQLAPVGIVELDSAGGLLTANDQWCTWTGLTPEESMGDGWARAVHPEDAQRVVTEWAAVAAQGLPYETSLRFVTPAGRVTWVQARTYPIHEDGQLVGHLGTVADVTVLREAEQRLRASEERLQLLVDNTPDYGIFMLDPSGHVTTWNGGAEALTGYTQDDVLGRHFTILHPDDPEHRLAAARALQLARTTGRYEAEEWRRRKDGSLFWANVIMTAVRGEDGRLLGFSKVTCDRTDRKASESRFEALLEAAPDAILGIDASRRIRIVNSQAERLFGFSRDELVGLDIDTLSSTPWNLDLARSGPLGFEKVGRRRDGSEFPAEISVASAGDANRDLRVIAAVRDVTDRHGFEAEVIRARDVAERAARARQEFLANMSHEIRTPMNAVIGMTSLLLDAGLDGLQRDYVETIRTSGDHLLTIINDILDYAKIDAGRLVLEQLRFDLRQWVHESVELLAAQAHEKGLDLAYDLGPDVPTRVVGDPGRLRQVLVNLLSNAVKFTSAGQVVVRVDVDERGDSDLRVRVTVEDSGIGIHPARLNALFEPFTQADSATTRVFGGTGLGLAISKHLAEHMGGDLRLTSCPGEGTTAVFTFRTVEDTTHPAPAPVSPTFAGCRLLIVEDNLATQQILAGWAHRRDLAHQCVTDAADAVRLVDAGADFHFAVIDSGLPGADAAELGAALRQRAPGLHLVLLSSSGMHAQENSQPGTFSAVLSKPVREDRLIDVLDSLHRTGEVSAVTGRAGDSQFDLPENRVPMSILVVEDHPVNQKVAQHLLSRFGYRSDVAGSGREALAALEARHYDLVLMDIQMPEMDGLETTREIRRRWPERVTQVVAMTANVAAEDVRAAHEAGMNGFLGKPIDVGDLGGLLCRAARRPQPSSAAPPVDGLIDPGALTVLTEQLGPEVVQELVELFLDTLGQTVAEIERSHQAHDRQELLRRAHALKGSARTVGAQTLGQLLDELESLAPSAEWSAIDPVVARVHAQWAPLHDALTANGSRAQPQPSPAAGGRGAT